MKFKIEALEQEQSKRIYLVEAETREEAKDIIFCGGGEDENCELLSDERYNFEASIEKIEEVDDE